MHEHLKFDSGKIIMVSIIIMATAVIFLTIGFYIGSTGTVAITESTADLTPTASTTANTSATSTPDTTGWKTYTNEKYGFSFKYPSDWTLDDSIAGKVSINSPKNQAIKKKIDEGTQYGEGYIADITFNEYDDLTSADGNNPKKYQSFSDLIADKSYYPQGVTSTTLAGQSAYKGIEGGLGQYFSYILQKDGRIYDIFFGNRETENQLTETDKTILSTFQFTSK